MRLNSSHTLPVLHSQSGHLLQCRFTLKFFPVFEQCRLTSPIRSSLPQLTLVAFSEQKRIEDELAAPSWHAKDSVHVEGPLSVQSACQSAGWATLEEMTPNTRTAA